MKMLGYGLLLMVALPLWPETPQERAWNMIHAGATDRQHADQRQKAVTALGLLGGDKRAVALAEDALKDDRPEVRVAAAKALGKMPSPTSQAKLEAALSDSEIEVSLAAANVLHQMHNEAAYDIYYEVLTGERKASKGVIAEQLGVLQDKKKLAKMGIEEGLGYVPFAGIGMSAFKALFQGDTSPVRAAAALALAKDPDPKSTEALTKALDDKSWPVRAAVLESIAVRGDPKLLAAVQPSLSDARDVVRYTAAATVLRLSAKSPPPLANPAPVPPLTKRKS